jgi:cupin fold WbuC family metalloprotein
MSADAASLGLRPGSPGTFVADGPVVRLPDGAIEFLKAEAAKSERKRVRFNAHPDSKDLLHEMIIVLDRATYVQPHKHLAKMESFHVIEGEAQVVLFDDAGRVTDVVELGPAGSGRCFFYRLRAPVFHTVVIHSPCLVIHETTNGPFKPEETVYADWSPAEKDGPAAISAYLADLKPRISAIRP